MKLFNHILYISLFLLFSTNAAAAVKNCDRKGRVTGVFINIGNGDVYTRLETTTKFVKQAYILNGSKPAFARLLAKTLLNSFLFYEVVKLNCDNGSEKFASISTFPK